MQKNVFCIFCPTSFLVAFCKQTFWYFRIPWWVWRFGQCGLPTASYKGKEQDEGYANCPCKGMVKVVCYHRSRQLSMQVIHVNQLHLLQFHSKLGHVLASEAVWRYHHSDVVWHHVCNLLRVEWCILNTEGGVKHVEWRAGNPAELTICHNHLDFWLVSLILVFCLCQYFFAVQAMEHAVVGHC